MKRVFRDAILGFVWFTAWLTPYMLLAVHLTLDQYLWWFAMQVVLVPPLSAGFGWLLRRRPQGPLYLRGWNVMWMRNEPFMFLTMGKNAYYEAWFTGLLLQNPSRWQTRNIGVFRHGGVPKALKEESP